MVRRLLAIASSLVVVLLACTGDDPAPVGPTDPDGGTSSSSSTGGTSGDSGVIPTKPLVPTGGACTMGAECIDKVCTDSKCAAPSGTDGAQNGNESDVDCGGSAPPCTLGKKCFDHDDCASKGCDDTKVCVKRSCTAKAGGRTCGEEKNQESCCTALPIEDGGKLLDKYLVTAGRMRQFLTRENHKIQEWSKKNPSDMSSEALSQVTPLQEYLPNDNTVKYLGTQGQLGGSIRPVEDYAGAPDPMFSYCFAKPGTFGGHTFDTAENLTEGETRGFTQEQLDALPLNCVPYPLFAAFCGWDGGRVPTAAELDKAYGPKTYPWGDTPRAGGYGIRPPTASPPIFGPATKPMVDPTDRAQCDAASGGPCVTDYAAWRSWWTTPNAANGNDMAAAIAPPGRFPKGKGPRGHMDLAGLLIEWTADASTDVTVTYRQTPSVTMKRRHWYKGGSFEGAAVGVSADQPVMLKHNQTGGRCIYDR